MGLVRNDYGLFVLRAFAGSAFHFHGSQMLFGAFGGHGIEGTAGWMKSIGIPFPTLSSITAGGTEFLGGMAFLTGIGTRLLSAPVAFAMLVGALTAHTGFDAQTGGMEYPLVLAAVAVSLGLSGPGRLSLGAGRLDLPLLMPQERAALASASCGRLSFLNHAGGRCDSSYPGSFEPGSQSPGQSCCSAIRAPSERRRGRRRLRGRPRRGG